MNRLTKNFNGEYYHKNANTIMFNSETDYNAIQKLGKLEDIEEELGCPLEIIFKALEEDIIDAEGSRVSVCFEYIQASKEWLLIGKFCRTAYYVKDYQKTWWLKGE